MAESWAAKSLPQSEFMQSLLKCCPQHEGPDTREKLMVNVKKDIENMEVCFNRKTPKH